MTTWQERLVDEYNELTTKIEKLEIFIMSPAFTELDSIDQTLLNRQLLAMSAYQTVMIDRMRKHELLDQ